MPDIIQLLPDHVANQIAAGEVIQRPASAVKELLENSIDAGSTSVQLIVKDAGKTLIRVIDNGSGMSDTDARMCFERHATSKIKSADELFSIQTKGFRGEAMASIAAVAQVELKTRKHKDELGTRLELEGSEVKLQETCNCPAGTSISVKNLFFNVPARRNFLKSDNVEFRHIIEEFQRVAIAHPEVDFSLHHNDSELFHLRKGTLRQRLVGLFGDAYNQRLVPVEENTTIVNLSGFVGKPEYARKSRGEQFFFVNKRFIKSPYLHHAVQNAFEQLLPKDAFPSYFIMMEVDPKTIDVNIHPTKTEIKFEDEKSIYTFLKAAVKQSLGKYNIAPTLDFEQEVSIPLPTGKSREEILMNPPTIKVNKNYNPFAKEEAEILQRSGAKQPSFTTKQFESFAPAKNEERRPSSADQRNENEEQLTRSTAYQLHNKYILAHIKTGLAVIDQQAAHERILYEKFFESAGRQQGVSQQQLFPQTLEFSALDAALLKELLPELKGLGFDLNEFGKNTFIVHGIPADLAEQNIQDILDTMLNDYKESRGNKAALAELKRDIVARSVSKKLSVRSGEPLNAEEMNHLVETLFSCKQPYSSPSGKPTLITLGLEEIDKKFGK